MIAFANYIRGLRRTCPNPARPSIKTNDYLKYIKIKSHIFMNVALLSYLHYFRRVVLLSF